MNVRFDRRLDVEAEASGFSKKMARELEGYMEEVGVDGDGVGVGEAQSEAEGNEVGNSEENGDGDAEEDGELEEMLAERSIDGEGDNSSLVVKSLDGDDVVDGMTILKLMDEKIPAAISEVQRKETMSGLGDVNDSKIRTHTTKAAKGWVI